MYLDDIFVYINADKEHFQHLKLILEWLKANELYSGKSKCEIATSPTELFGFVIVKEGLNIGHDQ